MPIVERELYGFSLPSPSPKVGSSLESFELRTSTDKGRYKNFVYTLSFPLPNVYRVLLTGPDRPRPPHDNVILPYNPHSFKLTALEEYKATFDFPSQSGPDELDGSNRKRILEISWKEHITLVSYEYIDNEKRKLLGDLNNRSYALTEKGVMRHWWIEVDNLHLGLGEKAAPLDLSNRSFTMHGSDSANYDAYNTDPLYKHTPYLISTPKAKEGYEDVQSTYAIYHPTNSSGVWDIHSLHDDPWGQFKTYTQDYGGLEEYVLVGKGVKEVVRTFAELVGRPRLVGRDWLGYLASGMGLGESDHPIAQDLLSTWPDLCKKHNIPCSAMHLSSGYTADEKTGNRYVFTMNKKRYPDFKGMVAHFHKNGIKVVPNIKPYALQTHPHYKRLESGDALFRDPAIDEPVVTRIWSSGVGDNEKGSWVDMISEEGRKWWAEGVRSLIEAGCDGMWDDNNEYYLHDDDFLSSTQFPHEIASPIQGKGSVGLLGRMINTELMNYVSHTELEKANPERRTYVLTRSGNVGTFKYANSTWSGDNWTSWHCLRGSQAIQINAGMSLMQSYGSDIGGFAGPLPTPEMFVRWVQLGVTHSRFCIHSFKPNKDDPSGAAATNTPWMYPEVLPIIRDAIKWRYEYLPFFNHLMWLSHEEAIPTTAWLGYGDFASDPNLYTQEILEGFDAWLGIGNILVVPALFKGQLTREVYFPKSSKDDDHVYFDLHAPHRRYPAGTKATIATPLEHFGLFAREGSVIPVGKDYATVTEIKGPGRTTIDGVDVKLESDGGVVGLDDWRGIKIFPSTDPKKEYEGRWIEDDGISAKPKKTIIKVNYKGDKDSVEVKVNFEKNEFKTLWGNKVHIILPAGDERTVKGSKEVEKNGKKSWEIEF
ncbi:glicosidase [Kwoniella mangroviensis CBS 10435]|uniref:Glicosidase n=1 Tax=Kwoniella mangroviensis CBS 10435 TaxID=1331196 RepID=A0A1B9IQX2_9TREE|nr:glicosidase [Kwoniella mangroviensis CBS 10435]